MSKQNHFPFFIFKSRHVAVEAGSALPLGRGSKVPKNRTKGET